MSNDFGDGRRAGTITLAARGSAFVSHRRLSALLDTVAVAPATRRKTR